MKRKFQLSKFALFTASLMVAFLVLTAAEAFARAGGGGGSSSGGGSGGGFYSGCGRWGNRCDVLDLIFEFLFFSVVAIGYVAIKIRWQIALRWNSWRSERLLRKLARLDPVWDPEAIKARATETFARVQIAWRERDQSICRDFVTERLYEEHKRQTDRMLAERTINELDRLELRSIRVVGVLDVARGKGDTLWVCVKGAATDYVRDVSTGIVFEGDPKKHESFWELWVFTRSDKGWVLDEILPKPTGSELWAFQPYSEVINEQEVAERMSFRT
ncbi:MAG: Tim44-like domain-containing protein [Bdellovibrionota bacterium]